MDAEPLGGVADAVDAPAAPLEHRLDVEPLHFVEVVRQFGHDVARADQRQVIVQIERVAVGRDHRPLDDVLELADVAGPRMVLQRLHDPLRHLGDLAAELALVAVMNYQTRRGMSSDRSRSDGRRIGYTLSR